LACPDRIPPPGRPGGATMTEYDPATRRRTTPVIRDHHRLKGGAAQLGATGPGLPGPFGVWPADDHQDDEDQEHGDHRAVVALDRSTGR
jgi:hypothetical protein